MLSKSKLSALLLASLAFTSFGCSDNDNNNNKGDDPTPSSDLVKEVKSSLQYQASSIADNDLSAFVNGQYDLNFELLKASDNQISKKNAMISTFSIQSALAMAWAGAGEEASKEMKSVLHFDDQTHSALNKLNSLIMGKNAPAINKEEYKIDEIKINTSNNLYLSKNYEWKSSWLDTLAVNYNAGVMSTDFAKDPEGVRKYINNVVEKDTFGRIKNLIPEGSITIDTEAVITNAIYLKAPWGDDFDHMGSDEFHVIDGDAKTVEYIGSAAYYKYAKLEDSTVVSVPLRDSSFHVLFIMPDEGKFNSAVDNMDSDRIASAFAAMTNTKKVNLTLPSFEFETSLSLKDPLQSLGMNKPFISGAFPEMTDGNNNLFISNIVHKSFIAMNVNGIEAAAATAVMVDGTAAPTETIDVDLNRPFIFIVYETQSKAPLFVGRLMDPSSN